MFLSFAVITLELFMGLMNVHGILTFDKNIYNNPIITFLCSGPSLSVPNSPEFTFTQETLNRLVPSDGKGHWYSGYLAVSGVNKRGIWKYLDT